jgi:hypothetical protein
LRGFTRIHVARLRFKEEEELGQKAKKFLKKGNPGVVWYVSWGYAHGTIMAPPTSQASAVLK